MMGKCLYWRPAKYVARRRFLKADDNDLICRTRFTGGHRGPSRRWEFAQERAFEYCVQCRVGIRGNRGQPGGHETVTYASPRWNDPAVSVISSGDATLGWRLASR